MAMMNAAVVTSFGEAPRYQQLEIPQPASREEILVDVLAAGLHPRVRSGAAGTHYTSSGRLPMVPGIDAVGRREDGRQIYFVVGDDALGTMAEKAVAHARRSIELPDGADVRRIAAAMNPAMSSWVALRRRVETVRDQTVLVLGATGSAGSMAVQVAKRLGAERVVGAGRDTERLQSLAAIGADETVQLSDDLEATARGLATAAAEADIVLDYLWGEPAQHAITALLSSRTDRSRALDWIQIGAVAGPSIELPSVALRSANLRIQGCGQGSVSGETYRAELPSLIAELDAGGLHVTAVPAPLSEVRDAWERTDAPGTRTVLVP